MNRWLRTWSLATVITTVAPLVLGALVTSFRVGMADPVWPTEPWRLALIDWSEPSAGFIIEHSHRLAGYVIGGMITVLSIGLWAMEPRRGLRWSGIASLLSLLAAFGYLHGVLIQQTKIFEPGGRLSVPPQVAGVLVLTLAAVIACCFIAAFQRTHGWAIRILGVGLVVAVMIQGLFGGMRVYFNAIFGPQFAIVHGAFAQVVVGLAVAVYMLSREESPKLSVTSWFAVLVVYVQIAFGVYLRQMTSSLAGRLHLITAFVATFALIASLRQVWFVERKHRLVGIIGCLLVIQILLGVESWLHRFGGGFLAAELVPITQSDAVLRTSHAVVGYVLFAMSVTLGFGSYSPSAPTRPRRWPALEGVT